MERRKGGRGFTLLEWLFSNLVAIAKGGDVFVPLAERTFLRLSGGERVSLNREGPPVERILTRWIFAEENRGVLANPGGKKAIITY